MRALWILWCASSFAASLSCGGGVPCRLTDSFTEPGDHMPPDSLHDYVVGTRFLIDVRADRWGQSLDELELVSKDPDVLEVRGQTRVEDVLRASMTAHAVGTATIVIVDEQKRPIDERVVEVKQPDGIDLEIEIDRERGFSIPALDGDDYLFAAGGRAVFAVHYTHAGEPVMGSGVLEAASDVFGVTNPTRTGPDREFLALEAPPDATPAVPIVLSVASEAIRALEVRTVDADEIASIELDIGEPGWQKNGDRYPVWAEAFDENDRPIFGAPFRWTFDGDRVDGEGDVLTYEFEGGSRRRVQVKAGDIVEDVTVEAKRGSAEITTADGTTCATGPGALPWLLAALLWRRRSPRVRLEDLRAVCRSS